MSPVQMYSRNALRPARLLAVLWASGVIIPALCTAAIVGRVLLVRDSNHWGFDIRLLWLVCVAAVALAVPVLRSPRPWRACWPLASAAVLGTVVAVFDHSNVLVEYELWLARGMPAAGTW